MYLPGKLCQAIRFRLKKMLNPIHNILLMIIIPNLNIHRSCTIGKTKWGHTGGGYVNINKNTRISDWVFMMPYGGYIDIGKNCSINAFCHINGNGGLKIGDNVRIAANSVIIPANHRFDDLNTPIAYQGETKEGIVIDDNVWIGAGVIILDGVTIGSGSVIGAGSLVNRSIPPMSIAVGVPAKVIRQRT